ncbi:hypothetical protein VIGAN_01228600 [Vigna angularis var. angularis]|uniref:Uncharacterized protein n=1 Tax=Vigna angularis var. angularis TaxID=157739 RepID=A0A0S3R1P6_PHAAN|nr:hypothetical protein VIGAN_01228600 [Vigna angularis var. angularis]
MEPKENITQYITPVEKVANQLSKNGEQMASSRVLGKKLRSLTKDFESIVCVIKESKDLSILTVDELAGSLEAHKQRRRSWDDQVEPNGQALQAQWFCSSTASRNYGTRGATSFCRSPPWVTEQLLLTSAAMVTPTPVLCFFLLHSPHHGLHLFGTLSVDIAHLSFLSNLSLADNIFFSPIPPPLSSLSALRFLNLSNNGFNQTEYTQYTTSHTTMEPDSLHGIEYGGLVEKRESNSEHVRDLRQRGTEYS